MRSVGYSWLIAAATAAAFAIPFVASAAPLGTAFTYQGQLKDSGQPATGLYDLQVCLFDNTSNPIPLGCAPDFNEVPVEAGLFAITLDFGSSPFGGEQRYLELRVRPGASAAGYTILAPRQLVRPAPEALRAASASAAPWSGLTGVPAGFADGVDDNSGGTVSSIATGTGLTGGPITGTGTIGIADAGVGFNQIAGNAVDGARVVDGSVAAADINAAEVQRRVAGSCPAGQYVRAVNQDGTVACDPDSNGGGTVISVATGAGLTGGPITTSGTVAIASGGVTAAMIADDAVATDAIIDANVTSAKVAPGAIGSVQIDPAQVQTRVVGTCPLGEYLRGVNADGSVICQGLPLVATTQITTVDGPGGALDASIAIGADGFPVISHQRNSSLRVAKCTNAACTGVSTLTTVEAGAPSPVNYTSIAVGNDGLPVISYELNFALKVAKCINASCTGAASITVVDNPANSVGSGGTSIAIGTDGLPVISYPDNTDGALKVAKCTNAACTGAATITTVDGSVNFVGIYASIAIGSDGLPVISYHDATAGALKVAKCGNAACTGVATITTVDDPANVVGVFTSIAIGSDGLPVISYFDSTARVLKLAKCTTAACTGLATITVIDSTFGAGVYTSVSIGPDGLPIVAYGQDNEALKVARCANAACTGGATITVVDNVATNGRYASIAIGNDGFPVISYLGEGLEVAKCVSPTCQ